MKKLELTPERIAILEKLINENAIIRAAITGEVVEEQDSALQEEIENLIESVPGMEDWPLTNGTDNLDPYL